MLAKLFKKKILTLLPKAYRQLLIQSSIKIDYNLSEKYSFRLASSPSDFKAISKLIYDRYKDVGLSKKSESQERLTLYQALPNTATLVMEYDEKIIGTVTLIGDSPLGLPSEKIANIEELKMKFNCCEISCLAIDRSYKGQNLMYLFKYLYEIATEVLRVEYLVISTVAQSQTVKLLYGPILLFKKARESEIYKYHDANDLECQTQILDIANAHHHYKAFYGDKKTNKNLYYFFKKHKCKKFKKDYKKDIPNPISLEAAFDVILQNEFVRQQITDDMIPKILSFYSGSPYERKIKNYLASPIVDSFGIKRKSQRFPCHDDGLLFLQSSFVSIKVLNRSETGFLVKLKKLQQVESNDMTLLILHQSGKFERMPVKKVWSKDYTLGLEFN